MTSFRLDAMIFVTLALAGGVSAQVPAAEARASFAELLKIPVNAPEVQPKKLGVRTEDGIVVEDLSWEALDGEVVPVYVLRRADLAGPAPAIICLHGSGGSRDAMITKSFGPGTWQHPNEDHPHHRMLGWARELARRGYVALAMTQRGLDRRGPPINQQANVMLVRDRTAMGAVLYEIRQAVTYLSGRPEVDAEKIGTTGMSFGGITAFYMWIVDDRVAAAAPICGGVGSIDVFAREGSIGYHGTYWWVPGILAKGDQARFAAAMAPRPLMLWAPVEDIGMPKNGVDRFIREVAPAYARAGASEKFVVHQPGGGHSFTLEAFEAMVEFFDGAFGRK